jgi:hypothetical protein
MIRRRRRRRKKRRRRWWRRWWRRRRHHSGSDFFDRRLPWSLTWRSKVRYAVSSTVTKAQFTIRKLSQSR